MENKYNWKEIQEFYDSEGSYSKITTRFGVSSATILKAVKRGDLVVRSRSEAGKFHQKQNGVRKHSEETKAKISKARKDYLAANPDKVPYLMNHYSKGDSYPEKYFIECLAGTNFIKKFRFDSYELDFANVEMGVDLEIDGGQHITDKRIAEHDIRRNSYLVERGWKVIRINWPKFQELSKENKTLIVSSIINLNPFICEAVSVFGFENANYISFKVTREEKRKRIPKLFCACGEGKESKAKQCGKCYIRPTKIIWPLPQDLQGLLWEKSTIEISKDLGVSDKSIEKFCKKHGLTKPPRGYWAKIKVPLSGNDPA